VISWFAVGKAAIACSIFGHRMAATLLPRTGVGTKRRNLSAGPLPVQGGLANN